MTHFSETASQEIPASRAGSGRGRILVGMIDGTLSQDTPGMRTHIGRIARLLSEMERGGAYENPHGPEILVHRHAGVQGAPGRRLRAAITGEGINEAIIDVYAWVSLHWRPGDQLMLMGYSRGAYAVRSLAGLIGAAGLLDRRDAASARRAALVWASYESADGGARLARLRKAGRTRAAAVDFLGVFDTVSALGPPYPILSGVAPCANAFHRTGLGAHVRHAAQALAWHETRQAFRPTPFAYEDGWRGRLRQRWFPGCHADIGGQHEGLDQTRPLGALPLRWMLEEAEIAGLTLPPGWRGRFPTDPCAPMVGSWRGLGALFLHRRARRPDPRDEIDPSLDLRRSARRSLVGAAPAM